MPKLPASRSTVSEAPLGRLLAHQVDRAGGGRRAVEEAAGALQDLDALDVVELVEADLGLGRAVGQHQAARHRVEAADDEEVGDAALRLRVEAADVAPGRRPARGRPARSKSREGTTPTLAGVSSSDMRQLGRQGVRGRDLGQRLDEQHVLVGGDRRAGRCGRDRIFLLDGGRRSGLLGGGRRHGDEAAGPQDQQAGQQT